MEREWVSNRDVGTSEEEAPVEFTVLQWNILSQVILILHTC